MPDVEATRELTDIECIEQAERAASLKAGDPKFDFNYWATAKDFCDDDRKIIFGVFSNEEFCKKVSVHYNKILDSGPTVWEDETWLLNLVAEVKKENGL